MSSVPSDILSPAPPPFDVFIGPAFVIICCAFILYGAFCAQVYYYFTNYHDAAPLRSLVALLSVLETAHTALCIHVLYEYLVAAWGNPIAAGKVTPTVVITIYFELIISSIVQAWYIYRIWRLRRQIISTAFLTATLLAHIGISFRATAYTAKYPTWIEVYANEHFTVDVNCTFGLNIALDAAITAVLMSYLILDRSKAAKRSTKRMMRSLLNFAFSTGILSVLTSCGLFIALNVAKHTLTFGGMVQFIAKLYANSMLAVLNARQGVLKAAADGRFDVELSHLRASLGPTSGPNSTAPIQIRTQTTILTARENAWPPMDKHGNISAYQPPEDLSEEVKGETFNFAEKVA